MSFKWIKLSHYAKLTGELPDAARSRIRRGIWQDERHMKKIDGLWWVNQPEVDKWRDEYKETG